MTPRAAEPALRHPLERQRGLHRRALLWRCALRGAERVAVLVGTAVVIGVIAAPGAGAAWLRFAVLAAATLAALFTVARRFARNALSLPAYLERVETRFPDLRSLLRNAVEFESADLRHVSPDLAGALREDARRRLSGADLAALKPRIAPRRPALTMAATVAVLVLAAVLWPARTQRSWATLWNPGAAAPPVRLVVEPGSVTVTPGASLAVRARVWGSERAPRLGREPGDAVEAASEGRDDSGARIWRFDLAQLTRAQEYWVRVAATQSPRYRIGLSGALAPVSFEIDYRAPAYARLPVQHGTSARGDLSALRGSRATLVVTFDRDLDRLEMRSAGGMRRWESLSPRRWRGEVPIDGDGVYELAAFSRPDDADPTPREGRFRYRVTALADAPPVLVVRAPERDVDLPAGQKVPLEVLAQDDLGLTELELQFRLAPEKPWTNLPLARFAGRPRDAHVATGWDASTLALLPGQSATFRMVLYDDNAVSGRGRTVSAEFQLRFPSVADLYQNVEQKQEGAQNTLERVAEQARELQKSLDKLARQQAPQESAPGANFERSEEMRGALQRQQEIGRQIDQAAQQLQQSIEEATERNAFDQDLMRKLQQVQQLMEQIQSPDFKEALKKMQQALENLDRRALEKQMPDWREENKQLVENLQRTLDLLKKLREEEKVQELAQRAQDLKAQQDALNQEHQDAARQPSDPKSEKNQSLTERQQKAAEESRQLGKETKDQAGQSNDAEQKQQMEAAAQEMAEDAAKAQDQASSQSKSGQSGKAQQSGQKASESLQSAAERMKNMADQMESQQEQLDLAAVRRAAQDLVSLQREAEGNLSSSAAPRDMADRQTDLSEGTARVADSLFQLSKQTPFISPQLAEALGRAINSLGESGRELSSGNRARGEQAGRNAGQSLNQAILSLREAESSMCDKPGSGQGGRPNPKRIGDISQQQSELNQRTRSLAQKLSEQMRLSAGDRDAMDRLAREQERIRQQLEEVKSEEQSKRELLGRLDQAQREMKEVEEALSSGTTDGSLEEKQQRILSRLLDAQRSVNRRDFDPERESRPGQDVAGASPAEIPAELLRQSDRFRQDLLKSELDRYPAQYRSFVEAYLRSLNGSRR